MTHLLAHARQATPTPAAVSVSEVVERSASRWQVAAATAARTVPVSVAADRTVRISATSFEQILDILVDNAVRHGAGDIHVTTRALPGGAAVTVTDHGELPAALTEELVFRRGTGRDHGIGLALARSLAAADDARLVLTSRRLTAFTLFLQAGSDETAP